MNLLIHPWRNAFDFSGRSTRREYWLFVAVYLAINFGIMSCAMYLAPFIESDDPLGLIVFLIWLIAFFVLLIPLLSSTVRRLHDHDKPGTFLLIGLLPVFGWIFWFIMTLYPGTDGRNSYGEDPRELVDEDIGTAQVFD